MADARQYPPPATAERKKQKHSLCIELRYLSTGYLMVFKYLSRAKIERVLHLQLFSHHP